MSCELLLASQCCFASGARCSLSIGEVRPMSWFGRWAGRMNYLAGVGESGGAVGGLAIASTGARGICESQ